MKFDSLLKVIFNTLYRLYNNGFNNGIEVTLSNREVFNFNAISNAAKYYLQ